MEISASTSSVDSAIAYLTSILNTTLHIHTTDERMFVGLFKCTDNVKLPFNLFTPSHHSHAYILPLRKKESSQPLSPHPHPLTYRTNAPPLGTQHHPQPSLRVPTSHARCASSRHSKLYPRGHKQQERQQRDAKDDREAQYDEPLHGPNRRARAVHYED